MRKCGLQTADGRRLRTGEGRVVLHPPPSWDPPSRPFIHRPAYLHRWDPFDVDGQKNFGELFSYLFALVRGTRPPSGGFGLRMPLNASRVRRASRRRSSK
jgi:hypothetical protein